MFSLCVPYVSPVFSLCFPYNFAFWVRIPTDSTFFHDKKQKFLKLRKMIFGMTSFVLRVYFWSIMSFPFETGLILISLTKQYDFLYFRDLKQIFMTSSTFSLP